MEVRAGGEDVGEVGGGERRIGARVREHRPLAVRGHEDDARPGRTVGVERDARAAAAAPPPRAPPRPAPAPAAGGPRARPGARGGAPPPPRARRTPRATPPRS